MIHSNEEEEERSSQLGSRPAELRRSWNGRAFSSVSLPPLSGESDQHRKALWACDKGSWDVRYIPGYCGAFLPAIEDLCSGCRVCCEKRAAIAVARSSRTIHMTVLKFGSRVEPRTKDRKQESDGRRIWVEMRAGASQWGIVSSNWRSGDRRLASESSESADVDLKRSTPTVSLQEFAGSYLQTLGMPETADGEFLSLEARAVCANYTAALFGEPDELRSDIMSAIGSAGSEEEARRNVEWAMRTGIVDAMELPIRGIQRLVLEAVAYGMFLWDVERTVRMHAE